MPDNSEYDRLRGLRTQVGKRLKLMYRRALVEEGLAREPIDGSEIKVKRGVRKMPVKTAEEGILTGMRIVFNQAETQLPDTGIVEEIGSGDGIIRSFGSCRVSLTPDSLEVSFSGDRSPIEQVRVPLLPRGRNNPPEIIRGRDVEIGLNMYWGQF